MAGYKIVIVDDEPSNIRILRNYLMKPGGEYNLYQALTGEIALEIVRDEIPDLVITDWEMPGMDGIELIRRLRQEKTSAEIPILMCTGVMTSSENLRTALEAGATDYIRKPVDEIELAARVRSALMLADAGKKLRKEHLEVLENKKIELTSAALRLVQISKLNEQLIGELKSLDPRLNDEEREEVSQMVNRFRLASVETLWKEFETRFENNFESFSRSLLQLFPGLTPGERKLCALLRLNLTSKEIALIIHQNPQSVDMARYRLRKKMNLEQKENLVEVLMNIS